MRPMPSADNCQGLTRYVTSCSERTRSCLAVPAYRHLHVIPPTLPHKRSFESGCPRFKSSLAKVQAFSAHMGIPPEAYQRGKPRRCGVCPSGAAGACMPWVLKTGESCSVPRPWCSVYCRYLGTLSMCISTGGEAQSYAFALNISMPIRRAVRARCSEKWSFSVV